MIFKDADSDYRLHMRQADHIPHRDPLIIPGGGIPEPTISPVLLIDVSIRPRMSFYLDGEREGSLIVDAKVAFSLFALTS